jgi:ketosteroid isomerase-like protein
MDRADVDRWLEDYVKAWKTYDREQIAALFADDVEYRYHPYDQPVSGREAVVASWLGEGEDGASDRDEPGTFDAAYEAVAVDGDVAAATGTSTYLTEPGGAVEHVFDDCFVLRFDASGRCRAFTEWFMERPRP